MTDPTATTTQLQCLASMVVEKANEVSKEAGQAANYQEPVVAQEGTGVQNPPVQPETVLNNQTTNQHPAPAKVELRDWHNEDLCGCCTDAKIMCFGLFCPCCLFGTTHNKIEGGGCCAPCCTYGILHLCVACGCYAASTRGEIRKQNNLKGSRNSACMAHTCCPLCAVCQDAREVKYWGNQNSEVALAATTTAAPIQQSMN